MSQYIDRKEAQKSYRPVAGSMSPGLKRAREPYRLKNAVLGLTLGAFAVGVWAYSISAVKQDIFDDVDEEVEVLATPAGAGTPSVVVSSPPPLPPTPTVAPVKLETRPALEDAIVLQESEKVEEKAKARGVLQHLEGRLPWLLDSKSKTLVSGAPPVDNVGKMSRS